jgi:hypothetical protein
LRLQNLTLSKSGVILHSGVLGIFIIRKLTAKSKKHLYGAAYANSRERVENKIFGNVERDPPRLIWRRACRWSADEVTDEDDTYQSFQCMACTRVHLVNLKTGKVLGGKRTRKGRRPPRSKMHSYSFN